MKGLQEIVNIRATMNNGLSDKLEKALPETIPVKRPEVDNIEIRNPQWLYGFSAWRLWAPVPIKRTQINRKLDYILAYLKTLDATARESG